MVNIAGRSRGCSTCRRRRVKCDENRPICNRCERCGFECSGAKDIAFINQGKILKSGQSGKYKASSITRDIEDRVWRDNMPASVSLQAFEIQVYICYTRKYLLRNSPIDLALEEFQPDDLQMAAENLGGARMLHRAILSLSIIFFGNQHRNSSIRNHGYALHGVALNQLNDALSDPQCYIRDDVFLSVITMILLECFVPTGRRYYLNHIMGLEKLLELRGPTQHHSPRYFQIFKGIRRMIILASLSMRKPSILAREEWKNITRSNDPDENTEEQYLLNILADYTVLIAEYDMGKVNCKQSTGDIAIEREKINQRALDLLEQLYSWKRWWDSEDRNFHFEITAESAGIRVLPEGFESNVVTFATVFIFPNLFAATMLMLYNTTLIYVLQILSSSQPLTNKYCPKDDPEHPKFPQNDQNDKYASAEKHAALEIYRCVPYYLDQKWRLDVGSLTIAHLAVRTAWMTLGGSGSRGGGWMTDLLKTKSSEVFARGLWAD
ncbi:hypothetical protein G7Y89_g7131 [Cudoniella acicularis]|uniref:Zn(2)-C6 fungal-type domain-containing protein n=1 Tax=Cudoniella acicularis TaxID=354080 RepID=A0A8H4RKP4_9HELO|nr:hypothetical protein G7Y89_g7131 [Cudoniella acicularis]